MCTCARGCIYSYCTPDDGCKQRPKHVEQSRSAVMKVTAQLHRVGLFDIHNYPLIILSPNKGKLQTHCTGWLRGGTKFCTCFRETPGSNLSRVVNYYSFRCVYIFSVLPQMAEQYLRYFKTAHNSSVILRFSLTPLQPKFLKQQHIRLQKIQGVFFLIDRLALARRSNDFLLKFLKVIIAGPGDSAV